jgi:prepilin-type N-terminal cleavage/methylation domain-containing protein/prepilin-type processing-associated H-X9-DG protein
MKRPGSPVKTHQEHFLSLLSSAVSADSFPSMITLGVTLQFCRVAKSFASDTLLLMKPTIKPIQKCHFARKRKGFTLTEVLVVILIIAALAAIVFPIVGMLRTKASAVKSVNNLGQMKAAIFLYTSENGGSFPYAAAQKKENGKWSFLGSWDAFLFNYIGFNTDPNIATKGLPPYEAIGSTLELYEHDNDNSIISDARAFRRSYAMPTASGAITVAVWSEADSRVPHRISTVPDPARTLLLMERPGWADNTVARTGMAGVNHPADQIAKQPDLNGDGRFQYLFADGHIESLRPEETIGTGSMTKPKGMWTVADDD